MTYHNNNTVYKYKATMSLALSGDSEAGGWNETGWHI